MRNNSRISSIVDESGQPFELPAEQNIHASPFDLINRWDTTDNWKHASIASGDTTHIRHHRNRATSAARFEYDNNPYAKGMVNKLGHEVVGSAGPSLEVIPMKPNKVNERAAKELEKRWEESADEMGFRDRLFMNVTEPILGGEVFNVFRSNYGLKTVQVDFEQYEGIQFGTPYDSTWAYGRNVRYPYIDGMKLDCNGNVSEYHRRRNHPGSQNQVGSLLHNDYDRMSPDVVCHIFRKERPTQYRGISQLLPCIELFAKLRRYTEAVLETAENAASILGTIETAFGPDVCAPGSPTARQLKIGSAMFMNMPEGWKANPFRAEQPTTTYEQFKNAILHEIMACLLLPWNIASGDSSDYNFSSARMDHLIFDRVINVIRKDLERKLINRFFRFWFEFAMYTPGIVPSRLGSFDFKWYWPKRTAVDEVKEAKANEIKKKSGLLDESRYWQEEGMNWREARAKKIEIQLWSEKYEKEMRAEMGLEIPEPDSNSESNPAQDETTKNETAKDNTFSKSESQITAKRLVSIA